MKHTVSSWFKVFHDHETVFHPDLRCFMTMFHPDSTCFTVFHDHETNCFIADSSWFNMFRGVTRPWNKLFHCWLILIQHVSSLFHRPDSSCLMLIQHVSSLFHHCFITVSPLFHQWERALKARSHWWNELKNYSDLLVVELNYTYDPQEAHYNQRWYKTDSLHLERTCALIQETKITKRNTIQLKLTYLFIWRDGVVQK